MQHLPQGSIMGLALEVVLQGLQAAASVFSRQGCFQNKICKYRIFGQDRPVAVGTECVFVPRSFRFVLSIVSEALQHCAQRANVISQVRSSAVVFKADDRVLSRIISALIRFLSGIHLMRHPERWEERLRLARKEYRECVQVLAASRRMWLVAFFFNLMQRFSQFMVTVFVYLSITGGASAAAGQGAGAGSTSIGQLVNLWATQCFVSLGANCVPIPGSMGVTDYLMLDGYLNLMNKQTAYELQILTRGLSFYFTVLLSGAVVLICYLLQNRKKDTGRM